MTKENGEWYIGEYVDEKILEVWESFNGDLFFLTEKPNNGKDILFAYVRLYSMPECAEWGDVYWPEITSAYGPNMIWPVSRENWPNINSYEKNLFKRQIDNEVGK